METVLLLTTCIAFLFVFVKFLISKYLEKEMKPIKHIVKDCIIAFGASFSVLMVYFSNETFFTDFFSVVTNKPGTQPPLVQVFTGGPEF